jgi:hypothetical protein
VAVVSSVAGQASWSTARFRAKVVLAVGLTTLACSDVGAVRAQALSLVTYPFVQQGEKLTSSEMTEHAEQGYSVALSANGDTALVGARGYNGLAGAAWVYVRSGSTWTEQAKLVGAHGGTLAEQGFSVALSADGNTALIGAPVDAGAEEKYYGAAWVFTRSGTSWSEQQKLVATGSSTDAQQGHSVSLSASGNTALIGAEDNESGVGAAWVFTREAGSWTQRGGKLVGKHGAEIGLQGWGVALSGDGDTALIGGPKAEGEKGEREVGAAWVFTWTGSEWKEQTKLPSGSGAGPETGEGESVALSGDGSTALVGGIGYNHSLGGAWVFTRSGETWTQQGEPLLGDDADTQAEQGVSVALSEDGNTALVGGYHDDTSRGGAWAFERTGSSWSEQQELAGSGGKGFAEQGNGVALSADSSTALIGGPGDGEGFGAAWVFSRALPSGEPEPKNEEKRSSNNGSPGTTAGGTGTTSTGSGSSTPGIASTPQAVEELELGCSKRSLVLNDVLIRGGRVALEGSAAKSLDGKTVKIVFNGGKVVASATVGANGEFAPTAPLPPARLRDSNGARYLAESGSQRSLNLKLTRRLSLEPPSFSGGTVTLVGQVLAPLTKPIAAVSVEQELECGRTAVVKRFTPSASGRFRVTLAVPAAAKAGVYRLLSSVRENAHSKRGFATYSLPLPVILE